MKVGRRSQMPQHLRIVKQHAARALHQGLDDDAGEVLSITLKQRIESLPGRRIDGKLRDKLLRQDLGEEAMHAFLGIADRHGRERIAMIAALKGYEPATRCNAFIKPELHRHLHRDLDRDRAAVAEKNMGQSLREEGHEPPRQIERRLMNQPAEHDMRHLGELILDRRANMGVIIAVAGGPPARDPIDELAVIGEVIRLPCVHATGSGSAAVCICV